MGLIATIKNKFGKKPPVGETGTVMGAWGMTAQKFAAIDDDLARAKGTDIYNKIKHNDGVKIGLTIKSGGVLSKGWKLNPAVEEGDEGYDKALEQSEFVEDCFNTMQGSFDDVLEELVMDSLACGVAIAEKNYTLRDDSKIGYDSIKPKDPVNYMFEYDEYMNLAGMTLVNQTALDPEKFVILTNNKKHGSLSGQSDLRSAYKYVWAHDSLMQWMLIFMERYAIPIATGKHEPTATKEQREEILKVLSGIKNGTAVVYPNTFDVELLQAVAGESGFLNCLAYCDKNIVKSIIGNTLTTDAGDAGSRALGQVHQDVLEIYITRLKRRIEEFVDESLVRDLIDYNFADPLYPNFTLVVSEKDIATLAETIFRLVTAEVVIPSESWIREYLGLPAREEDAIVPVPDAAQGGNGGGNGNNIPPANTPNNPQNKPADGIVPSGNTSTDGNQAK